MTTQAIKYRVCDKCPGEVLAEAPHKLTIDGWKYEVDLCAAHGERLRAVLDEWTPAGTCVGEPTVFDKVRPYASAPEVARKILAPEVEDKPHVGPVVADYADKWLLTEHAEERMRERGIRFDEVMRSAEYPERVTPSKQDEGYYLHRRGDVEIVIHGHRIITVLARHEAEPENKEQLG